MQKIINRELKGLLEKRLTQFPAVALLGPRQVGKTTLAQSLNGVYFDLESARQRQQLLFEWPDLIQSPSLIILDEAQSMPEIFPELRGAIDAKRQVNGRFLLLGSMSMHLIKQVHESLAGRIAHLELSPFLWTEVSDTVSLENLWLYGGFADAGLFNPDLFPVWHKDYLQRLFYIDFQNWNISISPQKSMQLIKMLAAINGQQWNASELSRSLGINYQTVNHYTDYLIGAFMVRKLQPFYTNIKKRLIKSPKLYLRDTGLLHAMLGVTSYPQLLNQPWVGGSWEGWVIESILNTLTAWGVSFEPYYFRTVQGEEIDLILDFGTTKWAIEIKLSKQVNLKDLSQLVELSSTIQADECFLLSMDPEVHFSQRGNYCNLDAFITHLQKCRK